MFHGEQCFQHNYMDESMKLFTPQCPDWQILANNDFYLYCWCCLDMNLQYFLWENNAIRKNQLRSGVFSPVCCRCSFKILIHSTSGQHPKCAGLFLFSFSPVSVLPSSGGTCFLFELSLKTLPSCGGLLW